MPEGHTIHRLAREHTAHFAGAPVSLSSPQGRFRAAAEVLDGITLRRVDAYGKHLFYRFDGDRVVHVHLGLYGKWWPFTPPAPPTTHQVRLRIDDGAHGADLTGPTTCELLTTEGAAGVTARLGPDPLRRDADPDRAWSRLARRRGPIGVAIMDQAVVAGVGNVYRAEALFVNGIHPEQPGSSLTRDQWDALWSTLVRMLRQGVTDGRIVTVDPDELGVARRAIPTAEGRYVYKREACIRCGNAIRRWDLAGRWAYACPVCQPLAARP